MNKGKKIYIQIPCLNEEKTIAQVVNTIPKKTLKELGLEVRVLVIDDGSSDNTCKNAKQAGVDHILKHNKTLGLARSFKDGLDYCLRNGADIIVNTDGDNQYDQREIVKIIKPILANQADMVIGDRQIANLKFMPESKKIGNLMGNWIIRLLTGLDLCDASSGFRAFTKELAKQFNLQSNHTYTHEVIIQASNKRAIILSVPISFSKRVAGDSRLIDGVFNHIKKSAATIVRTILTYKAFKYLVTTGLILFIIGFGGVVRFLYIFFSGHGTGHIQSLVLSSVLINLGFLTIGLGIIADLISINTKILEEIRNEIKFSK